MQYTLRKIPKHLDQTLRRRARQERKSLNQVAVEALLRGTGIGDTPVRCRNLEDLAGTWHEDRALEDALRLQRAIEPELWR
jgi:hypothetical protein